VVSEASRAQTLIRVAFTLLGGAHWLGGRHYLLNLLRSVRTFEPDALAPVLFVGDDASPEDLTAFRAIDGVEIITSPHFAASRRTKRLMQAVLWGIDSHAARLFRSAGINVVFEPAQFYGWRLPIPALAWVPDFQDRHLRHMFSRRAHIQKWIGQWTQALSGRTFMLSSEDARRDCERFYPVVRGRTRVVRFAVPPPHEASPEEIVAVRSRYDLPEQFFFLPNQLWAHKNHICVVRALKILKDEGRDVVVAVTGNPHDMRHASHYNALMREVAGSGLERHFKMLGVVPYEHVLALMQSAAALLNPSRCEGWSTTVEEAKSSGAPLILSNIAVHQEQAAQAAQFFSPDSPSALAAILRNFRPLSATERGELSRQARTDASRRLAEFARTFCAAVAGTLGQGQSSLQAQ
jgi:glycosyltransferase involved in cell wall biosynthesis